MLCLWLKKEPSHLFRIGTPSEECSKTTAREKHGKRGEKKVLKNTQIVFFSNSIYSPSGPKLFPYRGFNSLANTVFLLLLSIVRKSLCGEQWRRLGRQWVVYNKKARKAEKFGEHVTFEVGRA